MGDKSDENDGDCTMTVILYAPKLKPHELAFLKHATYGNLNDMKKLLAKRVNVNCVNELDRAAVHFAAAKGNERVLRFLRDNEAEFDVQDKLGMTPIHWAAYYGHVEVVKFLALVYRVRLDLLNKEGMNVLHVAAYNGQEQVVDTIKMYIGKLKPSQRDRCGRTPLHLACEQGHCDVVRVLLSFRGCNIDSKDGDGRTPLHCAAECGQINAIDRLLSLGADLDLVDSKRRTPLYLAAQTGQLEALKALAEDVTVPLYIPSFSAHNNETILHVAARRDYYEMIEEFAFRCRINAYNADGHTALHVAVMANYPLSVQALLRHNANVNMLTYRKQTALHLAVEQNNAAVVFLLLQCPDIIMTIPDSKGKTPLHLSSQGGFLAITDMFIRIMIKRGLTGEDNDQLIKKMLRARRDSAAPPARIKHVPSFARLERDAMRKDLSVRSDAASVQTSAKDEESPEKDDPLAVLPTVKLSNYIAEHNAIVMTHKQKLEEYEMRFRDCCHLLQQVMRSRYHRLHDRRKKNEEAASEPAENAQTDSFNLLERIQVALGIKTDSAKSSNSTSIKWTGLIDTAFVKSQKNNKLAKQKKGKAKNNPANKPRRTAAFIKALGIARRQSLTRPYISLENREGTYDIYHDLPNIGPGGVNFQLLELVFFEAAQKFLIRDHYDSLASKLGFAVLHAKSIREQYGERSMWSTHFFRLMRIWLSTLDLDEYERINVNFLTAISAILPEEDAAQFRRRVLSIEEDYHKTLMDNKAQVNKGRKKELKKMRDKKQTEFKEVKASKSKKHSKKASKGEKDEEAGSFDDVLSNGIDFPESFDGIAEDEHEGKLDEDERSTTASRLSFLDKQQLAESLPSSLMEEDEEDEEEEDEEEEDDDDATITSTAGSGGRVSKADSKKLDEDRTSKKGPINENPVLHDNAMFNIFISESAIVSCLSSATYDRR